MNANGLKGYIVKCGYNTKTFLEKLQENGIKMSKNTWYRNMNGEQEFTREEIKKIAEILEMTDEDIIGIFFS